METERPEPPEPTDETDVYRLSECRQELASTKQQMYESKIKQAELQAQLTEAEEENARLRREVEEIKRDRDEWKLDCANCGNVASRRAMEISRLNQRIEELEGALREAKLLLGDTCTLTPEDGRKWRTKHAHLIGGEDGDT